MTRFLIALIVLMVAASVGHAQRIRIGEIVTVATESDPRRFSEPHLAIHPANPNHFLAAAWTASTTRADTQARRCAVFVSENLGLTWTRHDFSLMNCYDEQVAILPDGQAVYVALASLPGLRPERDDWLVVFHSNDGGVTWDDAPTTLGYRHDHPAIAVDLVSPKRHGWIYITSHQTTRDGNGQLLNTIFVARSRDGGRTFDVPATPSPNNLANFAEMPVVLSDGTVVASFVDDTWVTPGFERRRAWLLRSADGATTFSSPRFVTDVCGPPPRFQLSALAVDVSDGPFRDRLYFSCRQNAGGPVVVSSSIDRGDTWSPSVAVGSTAIDTNARRVMTLAVNNSGALGVVVVERREVGNRMSGDQLFRVARWRKDIYLADACVSLILRRLRLRCGGVPRLSHIRRLLRARGGAHRRVSDHLARNARRHVGVADDVDCSRGAEALTRLHTWRERRSPTSRRSGPFASHGHARSARGLSRSHDLRPGVRSFVETT